MRQFLTTTFAGLSVQLTHCLLQLGIDPLPDACVVKEVLARRAADLLEVFVIVTADGALVRLVLVLSLFLFVFRFFVRHVAQQASYLRFDDVVRARLLSQLEDPIAHLHQVSFVRSSINRDAYRG